MTENLIETIRASLASDASPETRAAGVGACRTILAALGASAPSIEVGPTATAIATLIRSAPPDQLLDLVIGKLRSMLPAEAETVPTRKVAIPLVKVPTP